MKKNLSHLLVWIPAALMVSGCSLLQRKSVHVRKTPHNCMYTCKQDSLYNGFPLRRNYWVAYADRTPNPTRTSPENEMPLKKLAFMEPVWITKTKGNYARLIQYTPDADLAESKGKIPRKAAKNYGWIKKDHLLLWPEALQQENHRAVKAVTHLGGNTIMKAPQQFIASDSLVVFSTPSLQIPANRKIASGSIVYLYKQSADGKSVLIGTEPMISAPRAAEIMLGWISADAIAIWGTGTAFRLAAHTAGLYLNQQDAIIADSTKQILRADNPDGRSFFEQTFPVQNKDPYNTSVLRSAYFDNIVDYSKNTVYNVLGDTVSYGQYQRIAAQGNFINVVFVVDISANNSNYFPLIKSLLQDLQLYCDTIEALKNVRFGAVTYRQNTCPGDTSTSALPLRPGLQHVADYLDKKFAVNTCSGESIYQPVYRGLTEACTLLQPFREETNIIATIGTTGNGSDNYTLQEVISRISAVQARLLVFQSISKGNDAYNDFILDAEKILSNAAVNIAELKKKKLVDINDVIAAPSYNMRISDSGIYSLDYPYRSMTQGFVLFPKKGMVMPAGTFRQYFDSLVSQVSSDHQNIRNKLQQYFRTVGVRGTSFRSGFEAYTGNNTLSSAFAKALPSKGNNFFIPAYASNLPPGSADFGVLLNDQEYDQQMDQFYSIYAQTAAQEKFRKRRACRRYSRFVRRYIHSRQLHMEVRARNMTLGRALYTCSGFISRDSLYNTMTLKHLKRAQKADVLQVFNSFKYAADALQDRKNTNLVKTENNGAAYYWLRSDMMPGTVRVAKEED